MGLLDRFRTKQSEQQLAALGKTIKAPQKTSRPSALQPSGTPVVQKQAIKKERGMPKARPDLPVNAHHVLLHHLVTEKSTAGEAKGQYHFAVSTDANKTEISRAVWELYGVEPTGVRIQRYDGKHVRYGRHQGSRRNWKKAIVLLPKGQSLTVSEKKA